MWFFFIISFFVISYFDTKTLREQNDIAHLLIYGALMVSSCILGILINAMVKIPSPADFIHNVITILIGK